MKAGIRRVHYPVKTLGPGKRIGIWFEGCSLRCKGCLFEDNWEFSSSPQELSGVLESIFPFIKEADGITITGGEPFDQKEALLEMLAAIKKISRTNILLFTGYEPQELCGKLNPDLYTRYLDAMICGRYDKSAPQTMRLRGSDNQKLYMFSDAGRKLFAGYDRPRAGGEKEIDIMFDETGNFWFAGIPSRQDAAKIRAAVKESGEKIL